MEGIKICSICRSEKPTSNFTNNSSTKDKLHCYCKSWSNQAK